MGRCSDLIQYSGGEHVCTPNCQYLPRIQELGYSHLFKKPGMCSSLYSELYNLAAVNLQMRITINTPETDKIFLLTTGERDTISSALISTLISSSALEQCTNCTKWTLQSAVSAFFWPILAGCSCWCWMGEVMQFNSQPQCFQDDAVFKSNSSHPHGFIQTGSQRQRAETSSLCRIKPELLLP